MKTVIQILGSYTGEILLTAFGIVIRKIEMTILRRKALKEKKGTVVGNR
jgi:hypothetical protein